MKNIDINTPTVKSVIDMDYFFAHLFDEVDNKKKLAYGIEYEDTFYQEHNYEHESINITVYEKNGSHYFINGRYKTEYGYLYSITDRYDDTYGYYEEELTKEVLNLINSQGE